MFSAIEDEIKPGSTDTFAGGVAGFMDIAKAAHDTALYADNTDGWYRSLNQAYEDRIEAVRLATGQTIENPLRAAEAEDRARMTGPRPNIYSGPLEAEPQTYSIDNPPPSVMRARNQFDEQLRAIAEQHPDMAGQFGLDRTIEDDAQAIARAADEQLGQFSQSASGPRKWAALLSGGAVGMMRDPVQVMTLLLGAGPGAGRTVSGRILNVAVKEALINGGVEAALQPGVQDWRARAGLPSGFDEAARNVAFAAGFGGLLGGMLQGGGEAIGRALRGPALEAAAERAASEPGLSDRMKAALGGDTQAARTELDQIRQSLPPEARGALDHADELATLDAARPRAADPETHDAAIARAVDVVQSERPAAMPVNAEQADRIAEQLAPMPQATTPKGKQPKSLTDFLIQTGGVMDQNGEVMAVTGNDRVARSGRGTLVKADGMDLDSARLRAAEAGYFDRLYGAPEQAMQQSTVADLLSLIDEDLRGNRILAGNDIAAPDIIAEIEATRSQIARDVMEFQELAGPALDDAVVIRALEIARDQNIPLDEAAERAVMEMPEPEYRQVHNFLQQKPKSINDNSLPEFVYHGTSNGGFGKFDPTMSNYGLMGGGSYFTENSEIALEYTRKGRGVNPTIYKARIKVKNAIDMDDVANLDEWEKAFPDYFDRESLSNYSKVTNEIVLRDIEEVMSQDFIYDYDAEEIVREGILAMGYDAITHIGGSRHKASIGTKHRVWIVYEADQIDVIDSGAILHSTAKNTDDLPPGWSDDELLAASANRPADFDGGGIDDPGHVPDWAASDNAEIEAAWDLADDLADDDMIPMDNGELVSKRELLDDLQRADDEIALVEACRT